MPTADATPADDTPNLPRSGSTRGPLHAETLHLVEEEFRKYRRHVRRWMFVSAGPPFRWPDADGRVIESEGRAFSGSVRQVFWGVVGAPFMKPIAIRVLKAVANMASERGLDRRQAVQDAAGLLKHRSMTTFVRVIQEVDARLVHGSCGSKDTWKHPPLERLISEMDTFIDGITLSWSADAESVKGVPGTSDAEGHPTLSLAEGKSGADEAPGSGIDVEVAGAGRHRRLELRRRESGKVVDQATIRGESLIQLFEIVSAAAGETLTWAEVERRWAIAEGWKGRLLTKETLRSYGRRIRRLLVDGGLGKNWRYGPDSISWNG